MLHGWFCTVSLVFFYSVVYIDLLITEGGSVELKLLHLEYAFI